MNQEKFNSLVRELAAAISAAVISFGLMEGNLIAAISGFVVALAMLGWSIYTHAGIGILGSMLRKALSTGAGVAVTYGVLTPEKAEAVLGVVLVIISIYFGNKSAGDGDSGDNGDDGGAIPVNLIVLFLCLSSMLAMTSCTLFSGVNFTPDGCVTATFNSPDFGKYQTGICYEKETGPDGKRDIDRYVVMWNDQESGRAFKATRYLNDPRDLVVEYKEGNIWLTWDAKAGLMPAFPPEVEEPPAEVVEAEANQLPVTVVQSTK